MAQEYSYNDLVKMQEQAIRRVRDMQERARLTMQEHNREEEHQEEKVTEAQAESLSFEEKPAETTTHRGHNERRQGSDDASPLQRGNPFANLLNLDKDKAIILPLLLLLGKENSDNVLLLALMYIMA